MPLKSNGTHTLVRTNFKPEAFIGRCLRCGKEGLPATAAAQPCDGAMPESEGILRAIKGETS